MLIFGSGMSAVASARTAAHEAGIQARAAFGDATPKLAIVFASLGYPDVDEVPAALRSAIGDVPIVGGSAGNSVVGPSTVSARGVSVVLLGGDDLAVATGKAALGSPELVDVVPCGRAIAKAADEAARSGLVNFACLVFAPGIFVDGEALVAAVRKGAGARAQLAGCLTGDDMTLDRPRVYVGDELRKDHVVLVGIFTRQRIGISARHGWEAVGPTRTVTRADGPVLLELDGRPALEVWVEDARRAGATPPADPKELLVYLANHYELGITEGHERPEIIARAPWAFGEHGAVTLSGSVAEQRHVRVVHASRQDLLRASTGAAADAVLRAGGQVAGALVLSCSGRLAALGDAFPEELALIRERIGAPIGGACVFGEIAKTERDVDAFFNTTAVVVAFGS